MIRHDRARAARAPMLALGCAVLLTACGEEGFRPAGLFDGGGGDAEAAPGTTTIESRDVEAPEVFQVRESAVWDGRPSLGGVWVAHPDVQEPERVLIRDTESEAFVVGALFRREREGAGPRLQVSSDAAEALGLTAGIPVTLEVTALRREDVPVAAPAPEGAAGLDTVTPIETTPLENPTDEELAAIARAGIEAAAPAPAPEAVIAPPAAAPAPAITPAPAPAADAVAPSRALIQVGIYSDAGNARRAREALEGAGLSARSLEETLNGRVFYRVLAGPAASVQDRDRILAQVRQLGYADAYPVRN
ncbi:MAG: SPOR domain-containing protein [Hasllibacter sp.]